MTQAVILTFFCSSTTEAGKIKLAADGVLTFEPLTLFSGGRGRHKGISQFHHHQIRSDQIR